MRSVFILFEFGCTLKHLRQTIIDVSLVVSDLNTEFNSKVDRVKCSLNLNNYLGDSLIAVE